MLLPGRCNFLRAARVIALRRQTIMMRTLTLAAFAALALAAQAAAQDNPSSTEARQSWTRTWGNVVAAAEKMPEENYAFKPAADSQSFRDLVAHTADSAMGSCSGLNGERRQAGAAAMTSKADLIGALKAVGAECEKAYGSLTDATATQMLRRLYK